MSSRAPYQLKNHITKYLSKSNGYAQSGTGFHHHATSVEGIKMQMGHPVGGEICHLSDH